MWNAQALCGFDILHLGDLSWPSEADKMTLRIREVGDHKISLRVLFRTHPAHSTEALGPMERGLHVWDPNVKDHVAIVAQTTPDSTRDPGPIAGGVSVHKTVVPGLGDRLRHRGVGVELPSEQLPIVA